MILDNIITHKKEEVKALKEKVSLDSLKARCLNQQDGRNFKNALSPSDKIHIIAEIKKASPSVGVICEDFDPVEIAKTYEAHGASAISVLTDNKFFQGDIEFLSRVRESSTIPILRKDFIIDTYQIYQSKAYGADAILLMAAILSQADLVNFLTLSHTLGLDCLVEVHTKDDLNKVLATHASIIGINNRDLNTFKVYLNTTIELAKMIPPSKILVSESGIKDFGDITLLKQAGVNAFLIGETLMRAQNVGKKLRSLKGETLEN